MQLLHDEKVHWQPMLVKFLVALHEVRVTGRSALIQKGRYARWPRPTALTLENKVVIYTVSQKNDNDVLRYNFNAHQPILIIFGRDIAE